MGNAWVRQYQPIPIPMVPIPMTHGGYLVPMHYPTKDRPMGTESSYHRLPVLALIHYGWRSVRSESPLQRIIMAILCTTFYVDSGFVSSPSYQVIIALRSYRPLSEL